MNTLREEALAMWARIEASVSDDYQSIRKMNELSGESIQKLNRYMPILADIGLVQVKYSGVRGSSIMRTEFKKNVIAVGAAGRNGIS